MDETLVEFLNVTMYTDDVPALRSFYADALGLPVDFDQPGHIAAMRQVCAHDDSEGQAVGTVRLYFLSDDPAATGAAVAKAGFDGTLGTDGSGNPMWDTTDPLGNSVRILKKN